MQRNWLWKRATKAVSSMRSYLAAFSLVLAMSGVASAQQESRSFAPGLSPTMPMAGPEMLKDTETDDQDEVSHRIVKGEVPRIDRGYVLTENVTGQNVRRWIYPGSELKPEDKKAATNTPNAPGP
jgi:hypothetical protein